MGSSAFARGKEQNGGRSKASPLAQGQEGGQGQGATAGREKHGAAARQVRRRWQAERTPAAARRSTRRADERLAAAAGMAVSVGMAAKGLASHWACTKGVGRGGGGAIVQGGAAGKDKGCGGRPQGRGSTTRMYPAHPLTSSALTSSVQSVTQGITMMEHSALVAGGHVQGPAGAAAVVGSPAGVAAAC